MKILLTLLCLFSLVAIAACGGSGKPSTSAGGTQPTSTPVLPAPPISDVNSDTFSDQQVAEIIAEGRANHPYWSAYWSFVTSYGSSRRLSTQYEADRAWEDLGNIPFKPQPLRCKESYQSPFVLTDGAPSLTLLGDRVIDLSPGESYIEPGFTATDSDGGSITDHVTVEGLEYIDTSTPGNYLLTYQVNDNKNRSSAPIGRMIRVYTVAPAVEHIYRKGESHSPMPYYGYTPENYGETNTKHPVIVFFHGWSASADFGPIDIALQGGAAAVARQKGTKLWEDGPDFLVFQPQRSLVLQSDIFNRSVNAPALRNGCENREFIDHIIANYSVDESRIYFIGFSNGVLALLEYLRSFDDRAAAVALIAGAGWLHDICDHPEIPYWSFIGTEDKVGFGQGHNIPNSMRRITTEQNSCLGENPESKFTMVQGVGHMSAPFLDNSHVGTSEFDITVWEWLLKHQRIIND